MTVPDTTDVRVGPEISETMLALLPLLGRWRGLGKGLEPAATTQFDYLQEASFAHDGRGFLVYESRTWLIDPQRGTVTGPAARELGFWRPGAGPDDIELVIAQAFGAAQVLSGVAGDARWDLATDQLCRTGSAPAVAGERRSYAVLGSVLAYAVELATAPQEFAPHLNAQLQRVSEAGVEAQ